MVVPWCILWSRLLLIACVVHLGHPRTDSHDACAPVHVAVFLWRLCRGTANAGEFNVAGVYAHDPFEI